MNRHNLFPNTIFSKSIAAILWIMILAAPVEVSAQEVETRELYLEAESWFVTEEYEKALPLYMQLYKQDTGNDDLQYKIGVCLLNDPYQQQRAIAFLEDAARGLRKDYKENSYRERRAPQDAVYALANAYLANGMLDKAQTTFEAFLIIMDKELYDRELVLWQMQACETARQMMAAPVAIEQIALDSTLNSPLPELRPVVSGDGSTMTFVRRLPQYDAAYMCKRTEEGWSAPRLITQELGFDADIYPTSLSYDGTEMILYYDDDRIGNLYYSQMKNGRWSHAALLEEPISTNFWESHGCLSKDGSTLYFTSNREGSLGGLDIYRSSRNRDGSWSEPVNLGPVINTPYNENSPWISDDGQRIYFSSFGHGPMGGYDLFVSRKNQEGQWTEPENLGYPINSTRDDLYFQPLSDGSGAYHSLYKKGFTGKHDIFLIKWAPIQTKCP